MAVTSALRELAPTGAADGRPAQRSAAVDLVRIVGVIAIVAGHNWGGSRDWVDTWLYTWHVPVFFVITGYLWKPGRSTWDETKRRARTLLVPYILWLVIVTAIWLGYRAMRGEAFQWSLLPNLALGGWWISRPYSAFWFVTALFVAAVLMRFLGNVSPFLPWFVAGVGVTWATLDPITLKKIPESAGVALAALAFLCIGALLRRHRAAIARPFVFGLVLFLPAFWLGIRSIVDTLNMKGATLGTPVVGVLMGAAISCGLILLFESGDRFLPEWARRASTVLATTAIPVILTHALVLAITERQGLEASKLTFVLAYFIPLAIALALRKTPLRKVLL